MFDTLDYFYDKQQYRYLEQVVRAFSGFKYMTGSRNGQPPSLQIVPARMASTNRLVASIMRNQSENTALTVPLITVWQTGISYNNDMANNRNHVDTRQIVERSIDPNTGQYTSNRGRSYTLHRLMPVPMFMNIQVDLWTSNLDQKYQLEEQILTIIVPNFDIQSNDNALDWSSLTTVTVEDITHSSRSIPIGTQDEIDIMTINLKMPFHLNPPGMLKQQNLIEQVVTNIGDSTIPTNGVTLDHPLGTRLAQNITTPGNHRISVEGGVIRLLGSEGEDEPLPWMPLLNQYGQMRPAISELRIMKTADIEGPFVTGTIQLNSNDPTELLWTIDPDSLPPNTVDPVNAVIEPMNTWPGGSVIDRPALPAPVAGVRYLILQDIGPSQAWPGLTAKENDIIQFDGTSWHVAFKASAATSVQHVLNLNTGRQLRFNPGGDWERAIDGTYNPGFWRLEL
jgi:hypothetical protein